MGAAFSSNQLAGARGTTFNSPAPALPTSYAFNSANTLSFGFTATFAPDPTADTAPTAVVSPRLVVPLKAGGESTVTCGPSSIAIDFVGTSITCPIANSLIGVGTAQFQYLATVSNNFPGASTYLIAFTTVNPNGAAVVTSTATTYATTVRKTVTVTGKSTDWIACTVTPTSSVWQPLTSGGPSTPNKCRLIKKKNNTRQPLRRDVAGYGPPDVTFPGPGSTATVTTTVTSPTLTSGTTTITKCK